MCLAQILGVLMITFLFVGLFIYICCEDGIGMALTVFGIPIVLSFWVGTALYIIKHPFWCF